jgi:hypothetical protein
MRRNDVITPKLAFPFELSATGRFAKVVEQDSDEEIEACLEVLLRTVQGTREEVPDYGIPDQTFRQGGVSRPQIMNAIHTWERRANVEFTAMQIEDLIQRVQVHYLGRSGA